MQETIAVIGLGYVGLPLAVAFGMKRKTIGFDINTRRVAELKAGTDNTREVTTQELAEASSLLITDCAEDLKQADIFIVTVPTPIDHARQPDLRPLLSASKTVGQYLSRGNLVLYESTVFPGCTEEICVPVLEKASGLKFNEDFFCGYSPERINPGDKEHRLVDIRKVVSGSTEETAVKVKALYDEIITAGTYLAVDMKTAEAAKVIENSQRDINIAFVNELSIIFERMGIDTGEVLKAASTKWNFLPFTPGLVGGHCIGVDPYYLTHKAETLGYHPEVILSGRRINDGMGAFIANKVIKLLIKNDQKVHQSNVCILGVTFKENCPDIRNTRVIDVISELREFGCQIDVFDPVADKCEVRQEFGIELVDELKGNYDALILAVAHDVFQGIVPEKLVQERGVIFDVKGFFPKESVTSRL
ncbi:MAG: Vi polysaccharide biosynthesis protein VipA/TviB [Acidobacteria bacterium]|nr:MAG: Vi polysaccharide biosynthesis protein VipA/TviB [Acidobacteriota bacterium]